MPWFKIDDAFHGHPKVLELSLDAVGLWTLAGTWCANYLTDGAITMRSVGRLGGTEKQAQELVDAGLWLTDGDGKYQFKDWDDYQPLKADVEAEREAARERMQKVRAKKKGVQPNVQANNTGTFADDSEEVRVTPTQPDPARPDPTYKDKDSSSEVADATPRPDVLSLLDLLDAEIVRNGLKVPSRNKKNADAIRLLMDRDNYNSEQVAWIIRWAANDEFWRTNILSASKLREKFPQLMAKAGVGKPKAGGPGFNGDIDPDVILGKDYWTPGDPPEGLDIQQEIEWKKEQRAQHQVERMNEAKRRLEEQHAATA